MDKKIIEKALVELGEDESKRVQSLAQFREWLEKHPFLSGVRQDDVYLLQFLRIRKFNMIETFKTFERVSLSRKKHKDYVDFSKENFAKMMKLFDVGACVPLPDRDSEGRRVIIFRVAKWNPDEFTYYDLTRTIIYSCLIFLEEEETQIAGISYIFDNAGISTRHLFTPKFTKDLMDLMINCSPIRYKDSYVTNLPSYAKFIVDFILSMVKGKLSMRFHTLNNNDELKNYIDAAILPREYGGTQTFAEMLDKFMVLEAGKREKVMEYLVYDFDWNNVPFESFYSEEDEGTGSFRKLEID